VQHPRLLTGKTAVSNIGGMFLVLAGLTGAVAWVPSVWPSAALCIGLAFLIAYLLTWVARKIAPPLGAVDVPKGRKCHALPTPLLGGVAVMAALLVGFGLLRSASGTLSEDSELAWMLVSGTLLCGLGLWDDMRSLRPRYKLLGQIAAILPFVLAATPPASLSLLGVHLPLGALGAPVAVFWLLSCVNVVNLIDGHDGLAGAISVIAAFALAAVAASVGATATMMLALLLGASVLGFLLHNRPPARIFLGDAGSMTIGFLLGAVALKAVPPGDPCFAIGAADRDHIHHRFQQRGMSAQGTLAALVVLSLAAAGGALASVLLELEILALATGGVLCSGLIGSGFFAFEETVLLADRIIQTAAAVWRYVGLSAPSPSTPAEDAIPDFALPLVLPGPSRADESEVSHEERRAA
jgi:UDP-GlcNAc:undecaprenyl-phosphate GlcNAc-1-phosphate transferase